MRWRISARRFIRASSLNYAARPFSRLVVNASYSFLNRNISYDFGSLPNVSAVNTSISILPVLPKNKTVEHQVEIRKAMKDKIEETIRASGLSVDDYHRVEYTVTVDPTRRAAFDQILADLARAG